MNMISANLEQSLVSSQQERENGMGEWSVRFYIGAKCLREGVKLKDVSGVDKERERKSTWMIEE